MRSHDSRRASRSARRTIFLGGELDSRLFVRTRLRHLLAILGAAIAVSLGTSRAAEADGASEAILDEIVAGSDANMALVQGGTAKYVAKRWNYSLVPSGGSKGERDDGRSQARASEYTVRFDYPRLRFDWRGSGLVAEDRSAIVEECYILDEDRLIEYDMPQFFDEQTAGRRGADRGPYRGDPSPHAHNVLIFANRVPKHHMAHPRLNSAADDIRKLRADPKARIQAAVAGDGLLRYFDEGRGYRRAERLVSPKEGYCVVRSKTWNPRFADPVFVTEATARDVGNGAYVVDHSSTKGFRIPRGSDQMLPYYDEEITLVGIDLTTPVDEKLFTVDGLDIPPGTKIQDRTEGRTYRYAVAAVNERDIKVSRAAGPMKAGGWAVALYILAGIALVGIGAASYRIQRRRRPSIRPGIDNSGGSKS